MWKVDLKTWRLEVTILLKFLEYEEYLALRGINLSNTK